MTKKQSPFAHLRPTTTPEMLDRALAAAVRFAPLLWLASFIFSADHLLPLFVAHLPEGEGATPAVAVTILALMLIGEYASAVAYLSLFQAMLFPLRPISPKALFRTALRKLPAYFFAHLLYMTAVVMSAMIVYGFFTARGEIGYGTLHWLAGATAGLAALYITIRLCLAPITSLIEDCNPIKAFGRSWHLTSARSATSNAPADVPALRWLAMAALPLLISAVLGAAVAWYAHARLGVQWPVNWQSEAASWSLNLYLFATMFVAGPLYWAGLMALYVEYRMRHEALDFYLRLRERRRELKDSPPQTSVKSH